MKPVYNGYEEAFLTGKELKEKYSNAFYCSGRHHSVVYNLTIIEHLESIKIKDDTEYRIFYNDCFCRVMNGKTDGLVDFFAFHIFNNPIYNERLENQNNKLCQDCGSTMTIKNGPYGPFWGCSNYPNCKTRIKVGVLKNL